METDFFNFQIGSITSPYYSQGGLEDSESSLLDTLQNDFSYEPSPFESPSPLWDTEGELSSDIPTLSMGTMEGSLSRIDSGYKEDFQKLLTDWNEHLGSFQVSDEEELDVKEMVKISEKLPEDIFDDSMERRVFSPSSGLNGRRRRKLVIKSDVKLERNFDGRTDVDSDSQFECKPIIENMSFSEPEVKIPSFSDDGLLFVPEQPDFLFGECDEEESVTKLDPLKNEPESGRGSPSEANLEVEEDCVDVETVSGPVPVLQAGDLTSLLEQFEASEAVNGATTSVTNNISLLPSASSISKNQVKSLPPNNTSTVNASNLKVGKGPYGTPNSTLMSNQKIRDSLPIEIIEKIKACGRKKPIAVIPAMPSKRSGQRGTRMQDAGAALSRNKLLKLVSAGQIGQGESIQLDHDYCSSEVAPPPPSFYHTDASEYTSDGQTWKSRRNRKEQAISPGSISCASPRNAFNKTYGPSHTSGNHASHLPNVGDKKFPEAIKCSSDRSKGAGVGCCYEKNSKKDSGLESGEVSDAGEDVGTCQSVSASKAPQVLAENASSDCGTVPKLESQEQKQKPKRKLNLQEYRSRRVELEKQKVSPSTLPQSETNVPKDEIDVVSVDGEGSKEPAEKVEKCEKVTEEKESPENVPVKEVNQSEISDKPKMHSVEVQTKCDEDEENTLGAIGKESEEQKSGEQQDLEISNVAVIVHHTARGGLGLHPRCHRLFLIHRMDLPLHTLLVHHHHLQCVREGEGIVVIGTVATAAIVDLTVLKKVAVRTQDLEGSSPSSSLHSATPPSSLSSSPRRDEGHQRRRSRRRSGKDCEVNHRSRRSRSCSPSWSSDCSSCYSRSRSPLHGSQSRTKYSGNMAIPPSNDWQPGIEREKIRQVCHVMMFFLFLQI
ncbi:hypothetical protein J437_LFUL003035 [Ladona fulva]|uniref:Uncharacterized protein n=1 Tax=Ladona fulva TaxID=123851 RepID=A0A8K0JWD0_LADFU|nr:hypothetical protein J437_LFUL003035 [Ladona fulva]